MGLRILARSVVLFSLALAICAPAAHADGQLDPSFGTGGRVDLSLATNAAADAGNVPLPLGDGRFATVGSGEGKGIWVTQTLANGSPDGSFGTAGSRYFPLSLYSFAGGALREPDGAIVVAGGIESPSTVFDTLVARLTPQGALDPSFGNDPPNPTGDGVSTFDLGGDDIADGVVLDSTGRIVTVGRSGTIGSHNVQLTRFNADGSVDSTFGGPTGVHTDLGGDDIGTDIAMQGDRLVVLASSGPSTYVLRYLPGGALDPSFGGGDGIAPVGFPSPSEAQALLVQPDGRIVVAGNDSSNHALIARLQADGSPDASFGSGGVTSFEGPAGANGVYIAAVAQSDDGKTIGGGFSYGTGPNNPAVLFRALADGRPDPAWGAGGLLAIPAPPETQDAAYGLAVEPDRRILVAGDTYDKPTKNDDRLLLRVLGDTTPPDTAITHAPKPKLRSPARRASFAFEALGDVHTTFQCKLIRPKPRHRHRHPPRVGSRASAAAPSFTGCTSPVKYRRLRRPGRYRFRVRAIDPAGNVDPTAARAGFRVLPKRRHRRK